MAVLKKSDGTTLNASVNPFTIRQLAKILHATPTDTTHQQGMLKNATLDSLYTSATAQSPVALGLDDIRQVPSFYPEKF